MLYTFRVPFSQSSDERKSAFPSCVSLSNYRRVISFQITKRYLSIDLRWVTFPKTYLLVGMVVATYFWAPIVWTSPAPRERCWRVVCIPRWRLQHRDRKGEGFAISCVPRDRFSWGSPLKKKRDPFNDPDIQESRIKVVYPWRMKAKETLENWRRPIPPSSSRISTPGIHVNRKPATCLVFKHERGILSTQKSRSSDIDMIMRGGLLRYLPPCSFANADAIYDLKRKRNFRPRSTWS